MSLVIASYQDTEIHKQLKAARVASGMGLFEVANKMGIAAHTIVYYESSHAVIPIEKIEEMAHVYGTSFMVSDSIGQLPDIELGNQPRQQTTT